MRKESFIWNIGECRVKSEMANYVNFARRMRLIVLHFQLDDHIPTMASYQTSIISEPDDFQPRAQIKRLFEESELVSGDSEAIGEFSDKYIVPEKFVAEYVEHLAQIKMYKEKKKEETERERMERLNGEYNDIDWVGLYNFDKLSSLRVDEQSLNFSHHKMAHWQLAVRFNGVSTNRHRRLILYQNSPRKLYHRKNMDESGHESRETIVLVGRRQFFDVIFRLL